MIFFFFYQFVPIISSIKIWKLLLNMCNALCIHWKAYININGGRVGIEKEGNKINGQRAEARKESAKSSCFLPKMQGKLKPVNSIIFALPLLDYKHIKTEERETNIFTFHFSLLYFPSPQVDTLFINKCTYVFLRIIFSFPLIGLMHAGLVIECTYF